MKQMKMTWAKYPPTKGELKMYKKFSWIQGGKETTWEKQV